MTVIPETLASLVVPIGSVRPYGDNPREGDVGAICVSLERNGQYRPIVVNERDGQILAGNHTWKAAVQLGWDEIAATFVDVDDETARRIVLVDNRSNDVASYDEYALVELLEEIVAEQGVNGLVGTGFDGDDLDELLRDLASAGAVNDPEAEWVGMPEFEQNDLNAAASVKVHFPSTEDQLAFFALLGHPVVKMMWWPESDGHIGSDVKVSYVVDAG